MNPSKNFGHLLYKYAFEKKFQSNLNSILSYTDLKILSIDVDNWKRYLEVPRCVLAGILNSGGSRASKNIIVPRTLDRRSSENVEIQRKCHLAVRSCE